MDHVRNKETSLAPGPVQPIPVNPEYQGFRALYPPGE